MTKKMWIVLITIVSFMLYALITNMTGMSIFDAYLSSRGLNFSIVIDITEPHVEIISPQNITYPSEDIDLEYNVTDKHSPISTIWYNIDGGLNNTITAPVRIRVPAGNHLLYLYANDTAGNTNFTFINFSTTTPPEEEEEAPSPGGGGFIETEENITEEEIEELPEEVREEAEEEAEEAEEIEKELPKITPYTKYNQWYLLISIIIILICIALFLKKRKKKSKSRKKRKK